MLIELTHHWRNRTYVWQCHEAGRKHFLAVLIEQFLANWIPAAVFVEVHKAAENLRREAGTA